MKYRVTFVSNSSSSSCIIHGVVLDVSELDKYLSKDILDHNENPYEMDQNYFVEMCECELTRRLREKTLSYYVRGVYTDEYEGPFYAELALGYRKGSLSERVFENIPEISADEKASFLRDMRSIGLDFSEENYAIYGIYSSRVG